MIEISEEGYPDWRMTVQAIKGKETVVAFDIYLNDEHTGGMTINIEDIGELINYLEDVRDKAKGN